MWFHYTIARLGRMPLAADVDDVHRTLRAITRQVGDALLLFGLADDHLHLVLQGSRSELGQRVGNLQQSLRRAYTRHHRSNPTTEPARVKAVNGRSHLAWLVRYVVRQPEHHAARVVVPSWQASCFPDLVGARLLPGFDPERIRRALPRLTEAEVWGTVGLQPMEPVDGGGLDAFGPNAIVEAAAAVFAAGRISGGRRPEVVGARQLALAMLHEAGVSPRKAAETVGCDLRTAYRRRAGEVPTAASRAACLQLAIAAALRDGLAR